jgi:hypothetical protein
VVVAVALVHGATVVVVVVVAAGVVVGSVRCPSPSITHPGRMGAEAPSLRPFRLETVLAVWTSALEILIDWMRRSRA